MARVNVDSQALNDARFAVLAGLMGVTDPDYAMGKMVRVWMQCLERETYVITQPVIVALFGGAHDAPEWLVGAELAEPVDGKYRIKGTQGRIEYLSAHRARARENGSKGGRPSITQSVNGNKPSGLGGKTPLTPTPTPTLVVGVTRKSRTFRPPTLDELTAYCLEAKIAIDPQRFIDHYTSNGWKVGGRSAMKDWKAAARNWGRDQRNRNQTIQTDRPFQPPPNLGSVPPMQLPKRGEVARE